MKITYAVPKTQRALDVEIVEQGTTLISSVWFLTCDAQGEALLQYKNWNLGKGGHALLQHTPTIAKAFDQKPTLEEATNAALVFGFTDTKARSGEVVAV